MESRNNYNFSFLFVRLAEHIGESTLATVLPVEMGGHEHTSSAFWPGTLSPQPLNLAGIINLLRTNWRRNLALCVRANNVEILHSKC